VSCSFSFAQGRSAAIEHKLMMLGNTQREETKKDAASRNDVVS
jgi:hypothetical protein